MDPLGVLSVAAGIVAFVDFGGKIVSCYLELRRLGDEDELPIFLRQLRYDVEQVLRVVNTTLAKAEGMKAKYPSQNKSLKSLASHCTTAHERMEAALKELLSMVDGATQMSYKVLVTTWIVSKEAEFKFTQIGETLATIREEMMMNLLMCLWWTRCAMGNFERSG